MAVSDDDREWYVPPVDFLAELPPDAFDLLCSKANRTLLGQNTSFEFVLARFRFDGEIEELIEIE